MKNCASSARPGSNLQSIPAAQERVAAHALDILVYPDIGMDIPAQ